MPTDAGGQREGAGNSAPTISASGSGRCRASGCNANREGANQARRTEDGHPGYYTRDGGGSAQSSNLLIVNGAVYVVDAGDGAARRIAKAGINVRDIGTIFLTHLHDDHTAGLGTLMSVAWDNQRTQPINVYGPPRTEDLVKREACQRMQQIGAADDPDPMPGREANLRGGAAFVAAAEHIEGRQSRSLDTR